MPLNKLDNFIKNTEGRILYVNPDDLDSTDSISNEGNSLARPFKTIQRALLEAARFSYVKGDNNDVTEKTTILLFPGEHIVDNRPGFAIYDNSGVAYAVTRAGGVGQSASSLLSLDLDSNFDLTREDNILYKFNSYYGGAIIPRGTSLVGLDLRKTKIRPKYVPNPTDDALAKSAIFRVTGACYLWQFSLFDGDPSGTVYTDPDDSSSTATPNFSHHKLTCFEFCDGVNNVGTYGITDLDMYYGKVSNAFNNYRDIDQKFPEKPLGFKKRNPEWEIVGAFASDPISISSIISGNGATANSIVTVTTQTDHGLNVDTPIRIKGVFGSGLTNPYNISTKVQSVTGARTFTYLLPDFNSIPTLNPSPTASGATVTVETDTVQGASPYIFNISMRSVWGMNGLHADGRKAAGFRSTVVAQFTAISLQKDDRAFVKYDERTRTYNRINYTKVSGAALPSGASAQGGSEAKVYHLDSRAVYRQGWETSHIKMSNDAFIQVVSVFAIGFNKHFDAESGADASITNSNSNFGQISLNSDGFKKESFAKDNKAFITSIVTPREISGEDENVDWLSLDVGLTTSVGISSHLYIAGFSSPDSPPTALTQGFRIGARIDDKLYVKLGAGTSEATIYMCDNEINESGLTTAIGVNNSFKEYSVTDVDESIFTIGSHDLISGESVKIISDIGDLPENITAHQTYYVITDSLNSDRGDNVSLTSSQIQLASSLSNAIRASFLNVYKGSNLKILSRVSEKDSGELGSPIQFDAQNSNWFIHVNSDNDIYNAFSSSGSSVLGDNTDLSFVKRISDERSLDEKIYKVRVVIPKDTINAKDPESAFIIQESSSTGALNSVDFTRTSIGSTDYEWLKNPRFISTCSAVGDVVTVETEIPHNLQSGDIVTIRNVKSTNNTNGTFDQEFNGRFSVIGVTTSTFTHSTTDVNGATHTSGTFTNDTDVRDQNLPRYERNDLKSNLYVYRNEVISEYKYNERDGIYHLYLLNASNGIGEEFTNLEYSQLPTDLYPQLDRDNIDSNPRASKTYAKLNPIGDVVTNDLKKSVTRETIDKLMTSTGVGLTISSINSSSGVSTITFSRQHQLAGIVTCSINSAGTNYADSIAGDYYNVKIYNNIGLSEWNGATAKFTVSGVGALSDPEIMAHGSDYVAGTYYVDQIKGVGSGGSIDIVSSGISSSLNNVIQVTGAGTTSDGYYRITDIPSKNSIAIAKTAGDPEITSDQYIIVNGPAIQITSVGALNATTGIVTFTTSSSHGLLAGNKFRVTDSSNNNLGDFIVKDKVDVTTFTSKTNKEISAASGYILKHGLSSNSAISDKRSENFGIRQIAFYEDTFTLTDAVNSFATTINIQDANRLPIGSYIQIDSEIMRVLRNLSSTSVTVLRSALGTLSSSHLANSLVRKVKPIPIEFRRPSYVRASGHTFEYLGYGPGNYSTGLPQVQDRSLSEREEFLVQAQERQCGVVAYTGMNNDGDFFVGNQRKSSTTGEETTFDTPIPTVTGSDPSSLSVVFDEVTVKERLLVEGGDSGQVLSQFDGPVTFNQNVNFKNTLFSSDVVRLIGGNESTSVGTGDLIIDGGAGVSGNVTIGGTLNANNVTIERGTFKNVEIAVDDDNTISAITGELKLTGSGAGSTVAIQTNTTIAGILSVTDDITAFWSSDERLKNNIKPIEDPLSKVLSISGNTFTWNEKSRKGGNDVGVIAQEIEKVLPEIVITRDNGYLAVDYQRIIPLLIESIKELSSKINDLEQKLSDK